jgi:hypothetical protein
MLLFLLLLAPVGCAKKVPELTVVEGVVSLGGQPLPHALVAFNPTGSDLPPDSVGTAVTDGEGKFKLTTAGKPGAVPGEHVITVVEGPPPEDTRGEDAQEKLSKFRASLKNRPIPPKYTNVNKSDAKITVKTDQKDYKIELNNR